MELNVQIFGTADDKHAVEVNGLTVYVTDTLKEAIQYIKWMARNSEVDFTVGAYHKPVGPWLAEQKEYAKAGVGI